MREEKEFAKNRRVNESRQDHKKIFGRKNFVGKIASTSAQENSLKWA